MAQGSPSADLAGQRQPRQRGTSRGARWVVLVSLVAVVVGGFALQMLAGPDEGPVGGVGPTVEGPSGRSPAGPTPDDDSTSRAPPLALDRFLYSDESISNFRSAMTGDGPFYALGDAGHGGPNSPGDGTRAEDLAQEFLDDPSASYWSQPDLPFRPGVEHAEGMNHARPMHAAWVLLTQPGHPDGPRLEKELKALLLAHVADPTLDFSDSSKYPADFHGSAQNPIFEQAHWITRLIKTRDMLGRDVFNDEENARLDQWFYGYANWTANWLHLECFGPHLPGRLERDYTDIADHWFEDASRVAYDGAPTMTRAAGQYTNRHAAVASSMSLAANYVKHYGYAGPLASTPSYEVYMADELLDHSRLFVEETLRFSVFPEGFQGDFGRSSQEGASPQNGWLYSINVLANLLEIAEHHAARGDMTVWEYGTIEGIGNSEGAPTVDGFDQKTLHFFSWSMVRYINDDWGRRFEGERLALPEYYHDIIPAALAHRFVPEDELLEAAWKREGKGFPDYGQDSVSQGPFPVYHGEGAKLIGVIEHALAVDLG
jgi:hypothetical protein